VLWNPDAVQDDEILPFNSIKNTITVSVYALLYIEGDLSAKRRIKTTKRKFPRLQHVFPLLLKRKTAFLRHYSGRWGTVRPTVTAYLWTTSPWSPPPHPPPSMVFTCILHASSAPYELSIQTGPHREKGPLKCSMKTFSTAFFFLQTFVWVSVNAPVCWTQL
jgi:hypothetical protein